MIDSKTIERAYCEKPASTFSQRALVAIGGLTPERGRLALEAGADSACVVTDVLRNADPEARTREWIEATAPWRSHFT